MTLAVIGGGRESTVPGIDVRDVSVSFGEVIAVDHADLVVRPGEVSALVGEPGCGRTTLLRVVAGLLGPDAGAVRVCGRDQQADRAGARRLIGWAAKGVPSWPELTVGEALAAMAAAQGLPTRQARRRLHELLHLLRLRDVVGERTAGLDTSLRTRLGLAQALVHDPAVLVLDDILLDLEEPDRVDISDQLRRLAAEGMSVLLSARSSQEAAHCAHRVVTMSGGRITAAHDPSAFVGARRWRIVSLDEERLRQLLEYAGVEVEPSSADDGAWAVGGVPGAVDIEVDDDVEAVALLRTLVAGNVPVLSFAPTPTSEQTAEALRPWWQR